MSLGFLVLLLVEDLQDDILLLGKHRNVKCGNSRMWNLGRSNIVAWAVGFGENRPAIEVRMQMLGSFSPGKVTRSKCLK